MGPLVGGSGPRGLSSEVTTKGDLVPKSATSPAPSRFTSVALLLFALLGLYSSFQLVQAELLILGDPGASLGCDMNPLLACSDSLLSPQAHLLGPPNSVIGAIAFAALAAFAFVLATAGKLSAWAWWGLGAGTLVGMGYVIYFIHQTLFTFRALCPYCALTWVATIGVFFIVWPTILAGGLAGRSLVPFGKSLQKYWALAALAVYLLITLAIVVLLQDKIGYLL